MEEKIRSAAHDFKGIGCSKIGYFKEVRKKIKELEKLNLKLAQRRNRLEAIFESINDGLSILDRDLNIVFANRVQETMFPEHPLVGVKCFEAFFTKKMTCKGCPALKTIETGETYQGEILVKKGHASGHYLEWTATPIKDDRHRVTEVLLLMRDVSKRKEYEHKIMQSDRMAAIGFLAAGIAHEINNPLTSIAGFSEGLLRRLKRSGDQVDGSQLSAFKEYLEIIEAEAYRCKTIIQNLLDFSRSSSGDYEVIALDRLLHRTASLFRQHAKDSKIEVVFTNRLADGFNTILGKETQLKYLLMNLTHHAFKAMDNGGVMRLEAYHHENSIHLLISHTGHVNPDRYHAQIFDPHCATKATGEGNPIDLSLCFSIVQHHQGIIEYSIQEALGGTFRLQFPVVSPSQR
jgi:PAS domain S-box-containing protein